MTHLNFLSLYNQLLPHINKVSFDCYPNNDLDNNKVHPALQHIGKLVFYFALLAKDQYSNTPLKPLLDQNNESLPSKDVNTNFLMTYLAKTSSDIFMYKEFCYQDNNFDTNRSHTSLQRIRTVCFTYENTKDTLFSYIIQKEPNIVSMNINMLDVLNNIHQGAIKSYKYVYPDGNFSQGRSKAGIELLRAFPIYTSLLLDSIYTENYDVTVLIKQLKEQVEKMKQVLSNQNIDGLKAHYVIDEFADLYKIYRKTYNQYYGAVNSMDNKEIKEVEEIEEKVNAQDLKFNKIKKML